MLSLVKKSARLSNNAYDDQLLALIEAAIDDLRGVGADIIANPVLDDESGVTSDYTVADPRAKQAIVTYCLLHFDPLNYGELKASYDEQKAQMRENTAYGMIELGDA